MFLFDHSLESALLGAKVMGYEHVDHSLFCYSFIA